MNIKKMISYRGVWMGAAMLWVMLFHSGMNLAKGLSGIKAVGYGGVDIFLFASGIGNYYSYLKDEKPLDFLHRRICRLAPVYVPFITVWCAYHVVRGKLEPIYIPGNILGIQGFSSAGISFNWYLTVLVICYLLTPYLAAYIKNNSFRKDIVFVFVLLVISVSFINDSRFIISLTRIPIYTVGMIFAKYDRLEVKKLIAPLFVMFVIGLCGLAASFKFASDYLWSHGLYWYPFLFITPFLCLAISGLSTLCEQAGMKWLLKFFKFIGSISFELYLIHVFLFEKINNKMELNNWLWLLAGAGAIVLSYAYHCFIKRVQKAFKTKSDVITTL